MPEGRAENPDIEREYREHYGQMGVALGEIRLLGEKEVVGTANALFEFLGDIVLSGEVLEPEKVEDLLPKLQDIRYEFQKAARAELQR